jgi:hypothetical protein
MAALLLAAALAGVGLALVMRQQSLARRARPAPTAPAP